MVKPVEPTVKPVKPTVKPVKTTVNPVKITEIRLRRLDNKSELQGGPSGYG